MESCKIINIKLGRVGGFSEAIAVHNAAHGARHSGLVRRHARVRHRPLAQHRALHARRTSRCPAMSPPRRAILPTTSSSPKSRSPRQGEIAIPDTPGRGYEVRTDLIERLTVRKETIRAMALVA